MRGFSCESKSVTATPDIWNPVRPAQEQRIGSSCSAFPACTGVIDPIARAIELAKCWLVDRLCGPFPETPSDRAIRERGDLRFTSGPDDP